MPCPPPASGGASIPRHNMDWDRVLENLLPWVLSKYPRSSERRRVLLRLRRVSTGVRRAADACVRSLKPRGLCIGEVVKLVRDRFAGTVAITLDGTSILMQDWSELARLTQLRELTLIGGSTWWTGVTDGVLLAAGQLTNLRRLDVFCGHRADCSYGASSGGLRGLSRLRRLDSLSLQRCSCLDEEALRALGTITSLARFTLKGCLFAGHAKSDEPRLLPCKALSSLGPLTRLESLNLCESMDSIDHAIAGLGAPTALKYLGLARAAAVTDGGLAQLGSLPCVKHLDLSRTAVSDKQLGLLSGLVSLSSLRLRHCARITGRGVLVLSRLTTLRHLDLFYSRGVGADLAFASHFRALAHLNMGACRPTDASLAALRGATTLTHLEMAFCEDVTDAGMHVIAALRSLRCLNASFCDRLSRGGLEALARSSVSLEYVEGTGWQWRRGEGEEAAGVPGGNRH